MIKGSKQKNDYKIKIKSIAVSSRMQRLKTELNFDELEEHWGVFQTFVFTNIHTYPPARITVKVDAIQNIAIIAWGEKDKIVSYNLNGIKEALKSIIEIRVDNP